MSKKPIHTLRVSVFGYGEAQVSHVSPGAAFAEAWRMFCNAHEVSFRRFMIMAHRVSIPNPPGVGDPVRVCGRNAWIVEPHQHAPKFIYKGERAILSAHHSDIEQGHTPEGDKP